MVKLYQSPINKGMKFSKLLKKILTEETDESEGKIATTVDVGGQEESGGFCEHNPAINKFAFENPVNMFIVFAFVLFTIQKPWGVVMDEFMNFMTWWFTDAAKKLSDSPESDISYGSEESFGKFPLQIGTKGRYLREFWNNRVKIYNDIKALKEGRGSLDKDSKVIISNLADTFENKDKSSKEIETHEKILISLEETLNSPEYLVFRYLCGLTGLGAPKAGFVTQLLLGKMGCVDSVNTNVYKSFFPSATWTPDGTAKSVGIEKTGPHAGTYSPASERSMAGYAYFIKYIQHMYSNDERIKDISRMMWDDWCEVIARKMIFATAGKKNLSNQLIFIKQNTGKGVLMKPYERTVKSEPYIDRWLKREPASGHRISREHETSVTGARELASQFPESKQFMNDEEALFEMYKKMYNEETEEPKKVEPKKVVPKKSLKQEPVKQTGEYLEISVPDKV